MDNCIITCWEEFKIVFRLLREFGQTTKLLEKRKLLIKIEVLRKKANFKQTSKFSKRNLIFEKNRNFGLKSIFVAQTWQF